jgi:tetratricopeptide (TPR) repeat protein
VSAQYIPPVPKTISGGRALNRQRDIPLPSPRQEWVRAQSAHFLAISGAGERRTREIVSALEMVASALRQIDPRFAADSEPTRLILFARTRDGAPYFELLLERQRTPGVFVQSPDGSGTMLVDGSWNFTDRTVFHELVHARLASSGTRLPLWLEEGLAEYLSTAEVFDRAVRINGAIRGHSFALRNRPLMPIPELFAVESTSEIASTTFFYAESWAVIDWMMRTNREAFFALLANIDRGMTSLEALQKHFHVDPAIITRNIVGTQVRPAVTVTLRLETNPQPPTIEPLDRADVLIELATFLGSFRATRPDAERFLKAVEGENARAIAGLAQLRSRERKYDEATNLFEQALQIAPRDGEIRLLFAESLLGNALGPFSGTMDIDANAASRFRRARQLALESVPLGADAPRADAVVGTSYLTEKEVAPGIAALERARDARPARYDVALSLYALLVRGGQLEAADRLFNEISSRARTPQAIFASRAVYVREQLTRTNELLAENRVDEAIANLQHLIDVTPDPAAKMDLQRQLMHIRDVGEVNRQIMTYNEAIKAANRGDTRKALEMLDRLLEAATDPSVIRDATDFRTLLRKRLKGMRGS